ncbi:Uncharacterised protein [Mycobacteroides abscessus subsp. abscessus]|nr:Uncharacterised protein [Mycobacteroides abscessus subsp. abscessus]
MGLTCLTSFLVERSLDSISRSRASIIEVLPTSLAPPTTTTPRSGKVMSRCVIPR